MTRSLASGGDMKNVSRTIILVGLAACLALSIPIARAETLVPGSGGAASWCGTTEWGIEVALAKSDWNRRRLDRGFQVQSGSSADLEASALEIEQNGDVAIIRDDGSLIVDENEFDYANRGVRFQRRGTKGYKFKNLGGSVSGDLGDKLSLSDDDAVRIDLESFAIKYYNNTFSSVFINSDGNLTFGESDTASTSRDLQRFLNGPPRIAPFFADLDPSAATGDGGVYVKLGPSKITITWWKVPEFDRTTPNTFQISVNPRGHALVRFADMAADEGIVGVSPGGGGGLELVDLTEELPIKRKGVAMAERFTQD